MICLHFFDYFNAIAVIGNISQNKKRVLILKILLDLISINIFLNIE